MTVSHLQSREERNAGRINLATGTLGTIEHSREYDGPLMLLLLLLTWLVRVPVTAMVVRG